MEYLFFMPKITTISPKGLTIELEPIIRDKSVRDLKSCYDISPYKSLHIFISDVRKRLGLYLFGEVICCDEKVPFGFQWP